MIIRPNTLPVQCQRRPKHNDCANRSKTTPLMYSSCLSVPIRIPEPSWRTNAVCQVFVIHSIIILISQLRHPWARIRLEWERYAVGIEGLPQAFDRIATCLDFHTVKATRPNGNQCFSISPIPKSRSLQLFPVRAVDSRYSIHLHMHSY